MTWKNFFNTFINEIYSNPPGKSYPSNKIICNHIDEIWSIDLADMIEYKNSNNKRARYIFVIKENFSKHLWALFLKNNNIQTITEEFSSILSTSKRQPLKIESDSGAELYKSFFENFLKVKNTQQF